MSCIYNKSKDEIIMIGGLDEKTNEWYKFMMIYNIKNNKLRKIDIGTIFGGSPAVALSNDDDVLHIVGGSENDCHFMYHLNNKTFKNIYSFKRTYSSLGSQSLIYNQLTNTLIMMGGASGATYKKGG
eukprot:305948_1